MNNKEIIKKSFIASIPVLSGYMVLGMGFGIVLKAAGYGYLWSLLMSIFIYAGSMQYAAVSLLSMQAPILTVALTTFMVNIRHLFYGISMIDKYKNTGKAKPYLIFALTDETYSIVCNDVKDMNEKDYHKFCFFLSLLNQSYWVTGSVIGSLLGDILPFDYTGIDFALTALFISVFVQQWLDNKDKSPAVIGFVSSAICLAIFGSDSFLIPSMIIITIALSLIKTKEELENE